MPLVCEPIAYCLQAATPNHPPTASTHLAAPPHENLRQSQNCDTPAVDTLRRPSYTRAVPSGCPGSLEPGNVDAVYSGWGSHLSKPPSVLSPAYNSWRGSRNSVWRSRRELRVARRRDRSTPSASSLPREGRPTSHRPRMKYCHSTVKGAA